MTPAFYYARLMRTMLSNDRRQTITYLTLSPPHSLTPSPGQSPAAPIDNRQRNRFCHGDHIDQRHRFVDGVRQPDITRAIAAAVTGLCCGVLNSVADGGVPAKICSSFSPQPAPKLGGGSGWADWAQAPEKLNQINNACYVPLAGTGPEGAPNG